MKRLIFVILLALLSSCASGQTFAPVGATALSHLMLELSDPASEQFRSSGTYPDFIANLKLDNVMLKPVFYQPRKSNHLSLWYEHGLNRWFRLDWAEDVVAEEVAGRLVPGDDLLDFALVQPKYATVIPDDYNNYNMWGLDAMELDGAWDLQTGDEEVIVCTIDTGCKLSHPDLESNIWINPGEDVNGNGTWDVADNNSIDDDENGLVDDIAGYDFMSTTEGELPFLFFPVPDEDYGPRDNQVFPDIVGHGTHVAGTSASVTDNGIGVPSASWNVRSMPLRAGCAVNLLGLILTGIGYDEDFAVSIQYAAEHGADIISISFGGTSQWAGYQAVVNYARNLGVLTFAAAGNGNTNQLSYPAAYDNVVAVAATDVGDVRADFSNYGTWVDLAAPGVNIWSTMTNNQYNPQDYIAWSGTSMASPNAASVAALVLSVNPDMSVDQLETIMLASCDNIDNVNPNYAGLLGSGRVNAESAVLLANDFDPLEVTAWPSNPPVIISSAGGSFQWEVTIENISGGQITFDAWTEVILPNSNTYGPLNLYNGLTLPVGQTLTAAPIQDVPPFAPGGDYTFIARAGNYPNALASDEFAFTKLGGQDTRTLLDLAGWTSESWFTEDGSAFEAGSEIPDGFTLHPAYPNPFNPVATVGVTLPVAANLRLSVFNINGREIAELADGFYSDGFHSFIFNAEGLSTGIYFIHAIVPGKMDELSKIMLIR